MRARAQQLRGRTSYLRHAVQLWTGRLGRSVCRGGFHLRACRLGSVRRSLHLRTGRLCRYSRASHDAGAVCSPRCAPAARCLARNRGSRIEWACAQRTSRAPAGSCEWRSARHGACAGGLSRRVELGIATAGSFLVLHKASLRARHVHNRAVRNRVNQKMVAQRVFVVQLVVLDFDHKVIGRFRKRRLRKRARHNAVSRNIDLNANKRTRVEVDHRFAVQRPHPVHHRSFRSLKIRHQKLPVARPAAAADDGFAQFGLSRAENKSQELIRLLKRSHELGRVQSVLCEHHLHATQEKLCERVVVRR
mmetsp:Transcript_6659/g.14222  ORF Transcript_6659/g.14222 Transcript_6659/m.14222 type:complete len:305 (-) Transcript_6659:605-1519(-)